MESYSFSTFDLFTTLPSELRIKIWKYALPEPRVASVRYSRSLQQYISNIKPPPLLHACVESRTVFLSKYTKLLLAPRVESAVFVDFSCDTIYFDRLDCSPSGDLSLDLARSPHSKNILYCAIDANVWEILRVFKYDSLSEVKLMPSLKTIALVKSKDETSRLHVQHLSDEGTGNVFTAVDSDTVGSEIRHIHWYVESLRWELKHGLDTWPNPPHVQMWLM